MTSSSADQSVQLLEIVTALTRESRLPASPSSITLDTRLEVELGLDSLGRSELISRIEQAIGTKLPEEALLAATPRDLLRLLDANADTANPRQAAVSRLPDAAVCGFPDTASTLLDALYWHVDLHPHRTHILYQDTDDQSTPISYLELHDSAKGIAGRLVNEGLRPRERVAVMLPTSPDYFFCFFAILMAGGIPVPIYPPARPQQIEEHLRRHAGILNNAGSVFLMTIPAARTVATLLRVQVPSLREVITVEQMKTKSAATRPPPATAGDIAFLQYTSGSTGNPKGVVLTHADLLANIRAMGAAIEVRPDDVFVSWLPLYHDMGLIGAWLGSLYFGLPLVSMSPLAFLARPKRWLQAIHRHGGTLSAAPNFAYELCQTRISDKELKRLDLSTWRCAFNGAEPVSPVTLRGFTERFTASGLRPEAMMPVYGLAEAAVGLAFPPPGRGPHIDCIDRDRLQRSGHALPVARTDPTAFEVPSCGRPLPGYRVRVVDDSERELPERHEGVLQFQGPSATQGYFNNPEATAQLIRDGWHDTGDRAYLAGGDIHLTGRVKDLIIRGGRNIYPYEIEQAIGEIKGIRKGCVTAFAAADPRTGSERLVIVAEARAKDPDARTALRQAVRKMATDILGLPPDDVVLVPPHAVLKTSSGKLRRTATRDRYLAGNLFDTPRKPIWQLARLAGSGFAKSLRRLIMSLPGTLYAGYAWALFALIAPWVWIGVMILPRPSWRWGMIRSGVRLLRRLVFVQLETATEDARALAAEDRIVIVANHQSYLDAMLLVDAIPRPIRFVAKQELRNLRFVGKPLERLGTLFVERFDARRGAADSKHFAAALDHGSTLVFFPEGTFRDEPGLLPFRMGAFVTAAKAGVPVVPVAIRGSRELMRGDRFQPRLGQASITIGPLLAPRGDDWKSAVQLRDAAQTYILNHSGESTSTAARPA